MIVSQTPARDQTRELEAHQRESRQKLMRGVPEEDPSKKYPCQGGRAVPLARTALMVAAAAFAGLASIGLTLFQVVGTLE